MDLKDTYNKIAVDWTHDHNADDWWLTGTEKFISLLQKGNEVLDVGCGAGLKAKFMADRGLRITGFDFSEKMIELAKEIAPTGTFFIHDFDRPLNLDQKFDGVFAQASLLHAPKEEIQKILKNITAPLKNKGYFYLALKAKREGGPEQEERTENDYGYEYKRFFAYYDLAEIKQYISELKMKIVYEDGKIINKNKTNWIQIIAQK